MGRIGLACTFGARPIAVLAAAVPEYVIIVVPTAVAVAITGVMIAWLRTRRQDR